MGFLKLFSREGVEDVKENVESALKTLGVLFEDVEIEFCYYIESEEREGGETFPSSKELEKLSWLFEETYNKHNLSRFSLLQKEEEKKGEEEKERNGEIIEIGPRLNFTTAFCTNAVSICLASELPLIKRIERSRRILIHFQKEREEKEREKKKEFLGLIHDKMTECVYPSPLSTLQSSLSPEKWFEVPVMEKGKEALSEISSLMGFGWDEADLSYYYSLFRERLQRNPTNVECFDLSQSNSEHSRHWFFKGKIIIDGQEQPKTLLQMVMDTLKKVPQNSVLAFCDNSSTIRGKEVKVLKAGDPTRCSPLVEMVDDRDLLFTAETHNFPTGVAPFPGAETGVGGRIRDTHATGRGSHVIAGTAGYSVGNLHIPNYVLPWEEEQEKEKKQAKHSRFASPLSVIVEASNGASDYGNKFGEPMINGFTRSFGMPTQEEKEGEKENECVREYIKPIMFSGGIGQMSHSHSSKGAPEKGMKVIKLGGPAYRIGVGGGAASSMIQGDNVEDLDFQAVQRGDAEMEQKVNRVIRACIELGDANPIVSIHDQGAGGNGNVLKEIVEPAGGRFEVRDILVGDHSLSVLEIWGAEYQENDALLLSGDPKILALFDSICKREGALYSIVGEVTGDGYVTLHDSQDDSTPFHLHLDQVLGKMPQKTFETTRIKRVIPSFSFPTPSPLPATLSEWMEQSQEERQQNFDQALDRVLRLLTIGSKRFLTTKVDRSVTGLVAQQQCVGPLHIPLCDYSVVALSYCSTVGGATAIGEQPIKGLVQSEAMGRLSVGEMLTNLAWVKVDGLEGIKCSGNWMWPAKLPGEDANLYDTCVGMCELMEKLGVAIDGGKDSLSMASKGVDSEGKASLVKSPGTLVVSGYSVCPDVRKRVTPDLKGVGTIYAIDFGQGKNRMGGSALAQVYNSLGGEGVPDVDDPDLLKRAWNAIQYLVDTGLISAGHDRSDGGLITTLLEMAFAGNTGLSITLDLSLSSSSSPLEFYGEVMSSLFSEELGLMFEVGEKDQEEVENYLKQQNIPFSPVAVSLAENRVVVKAKWGKKEEEGEKGGEMVVLEKKMTDLRDVWEATSFELEKRQANPLCVEKEKEGLSSRIAPPYKLGFSPLPSLGEGKERPSVAVLREEGSNGDREMAAAFHLAGFSVQDVTMSDLVSGKEDLKKHRGIAFVGGFSFADVLGSAKGWGGKISYHSDVLALFRQFYERKDTFSLGICNGCQLMSLLGLCPFADLEDARKPRFIENESGRFESRFVTLRIEQSPSIFFKGMEGSIMGCWSSHGEGRAYFPDSSILEKVEKLSLVPIRYANDNGEATEVYPFNPNGSIKGIGGLCSEDGRHMAIMPHPERTSFPWSWPWAPLDLKREIEEQPPWIRMFENARMWCEQN